jgi:transcriptional regulator with XRE-family HTH domain
MQADCLVNSNAPYVPVVQTGRPSKRPRPPFGARLHALREEAGLTQAQVAEKLGISQRAYAFWEREPIALRAEQLATLAQVLNVSVDALVGQKAAKRRGTGPVGKARRVFEQVSKLPRRQQEKILDILEPFVRQHANGKP